jgi:hypothetical protein
METMERILPFRIVAGWGPRPPPTSYDPEPEAEQSPMSVALSRFKHRYFQSLATVEAGDQKTELELAFDVLYVLNQLSPWLEKLKHDGRATLVFGAQGSERELIAERRGSCIVYWFRDFFSDGADSPRACVSAGSFISEWQQLGKSILDILAEIYPPVERDEEYINLRERIDRPT